VAVVRYNFRIDELERAVLVELTGVVDEEVLERGKQVKEQVQHYARERSAVNTEGGLADSIRGEFYAMESPDDEALAIVLSDAPHALAVEEGTGLHGPRSAYIFPRGPRPMFFVPRGMSKPVVAFKVQGQPGKHMFRDGLQAVVGRGGNLRRGTDL
jgi:hypothetical protein